MPPHVCRFPRTYSLRRTREAAEPPRFAVSPGSGWNARLTTNLLALAALTERFHTASFAGENRTYALLERTSDRHCQWKVAGGELIVVENQSDPPEQLSKD